MKKGPLSGLVTEVIKLELEAVTLITSVVENSSVNRSFFFM